MCAKPSTVYKSTKVQTDTDIIDYRSIIREYLYHWPLFILFIGIFLVGAYAYNVIKKPGNEVMATLQIQDNNKAPSTKAPEDQENISKLDLATGGKIVENEIEVLRSVSLIKKVVTDLDLWVNYTRTSKLVKQENLYKRSPVQFKVIHQLTPSFNELFTVVIRDKNTFLLKRSDGKFVQFHFGDLLQNTFGLWKLEPTEDIDHYIGATINVSATDPNAVVTSYQGGLKVDLTDKEASTLTLSVTDQIPQRGKDFLNDLIKRYREAEIEFRNNITKATLNFIDSRLQTLSGELSKANSDVAAFRSSHELTDLDRQSQVYLESQSRNDDNLNAVNVQLQVVDQIENYVNSPHSGNVPSTLGIRDDGLSSMIEKLSSLELEHDRLAATTPESNPIFDPINKQIAASRSSIKDIVRNMKSQLLAQKRQLTSVANNVSSTIRNVPTQERDYVGLKRNQTLMENLYTFLLQKREEISLSYVSVLSTARIVDTAYVLPVQPLKKYTPYGIAFAFGILLPMSLIFVRNSIKNSVTNIKQITDETSLPVISELSFEKSKSPIVVHDRGKFAIAEEFRMMRTKLHYLHNNNEKGRITLITSSISNEGKSFISTNLAVAIAASGRKTIILEMDLRKPRVSAIFNKDDSHPGISHYLNGHVSESQIIQHLNEYPNLDLIGSGELYPNPSELLEQERVAALFSWLKTKYDDIIIDTPPVNIVTDAIILSKQADVTLYVVRQGITSRELLPFIKNLNEEEHFQNLNIIFNGVERGRFGYSGYGYGYGYSDYIADKKPRRKFTIFKDFYKRF